MSRPFFWSKVLCVAKILDTIKDMNIGWLLFSSEGAINRKDFWIAILALNLISVLLTKIGDLIVREIGEAHTSFLIFFLAIMLPRLFGLLVLVCSYYVAHKRVNEIGLSSWVPLVYVLTLFLPTFLFAAKLDGVALFSGIIPLGFTFYLGLASPKKTNLS
jgi:uncharacterized membrane protein YhaH (DUF805 family)